MYDVRVKLTGNSEYSTFINSKKYLKEYIDIWFQQQPEATIELRKL